MFGNKAHNLVSILPGMLTDTSSQSRMKKRPLANEEVRKSFTEEVHAWKD